MEIQAPRMPTQGSTEDQMNTGPCRGGGRQLRWFAGGDDEGHGPYHHICDIYGAHEDGKIMDSDYAGHADTDD